ncbi:cobalamin biosynthesis protein CobG [Halomonas aquamarina]|uniref:Cobalamin biosynthesis protein CobG n=1 Tax=Vreelandella aquamarina TaxID=77097 RepID=A0ACC5VXK1_9GAMM|nr:cobalamin biosynthesis protein CobG [Halomonas aquamarina]MBZ5488975.1 cobalamin biosynthesis protein CobG [Halomonas aquamarina]
MNAPQVRGWCPGAWRPMQTGDGWLVRVRPPLGELTRAQALALCEASERFGSGLIELTNRANVQLRGVSETTWPGLMAFLLDCGLVGREEDERSPPLMLAPTWRPGDDTHRAAQCLSARGQEFPALPAKVGIAVDAGHAPVLTESPADVRIERAKDGGLLVRAEGHASGTPVASPEAAVALVIRLCRWFVASGGREAGRMARHPASLPDWARPTVVPAPAGRILTLGNHPEGVAVGLALGRVQAGSLRALVTPLAHGTLRVTPWRRLLIQGAEPARLPTAPDVITQGDDPRLSIDACPGAPFCAQASVDTRSMAARLTHHKAVSLHVSGCAKGCARRRPAAVCLTGRDGRFDVLFDERADGDPAARGLTEPDVLDFLENSGALHL